MNLDKKFIGLLNGVKKYFNDPRIIEAYESFNREVGQIDEFDGKYKIIIYHNDLLIKHMKSKFAIVCVYDINNIIIYVDDIFMKSSKDIQQYIILHEIGHIINNAIDDHMENEKIADKYAASIIGYDAVIDIMGDILANHALSIDANELRERMIHMIFIKDKEKLGFS